MNRQPFFDRKTCFFIGIALCLFLALAAIIIQYGGRSQGGNQAWIPRRERELAARLKGVGLPREAARALELYLQAESTTPREWSTTAYSIAQLYMEEKDYAAAIPWLYRVELGDPDPGLKEKTGPLIVTCLERLGLHQAAEYALTARTALDPNVRKEETRGEIVIARIGQESITLNQINQAIEDLPPWIRKEFTDPQKKREFAKQYVAEELLLRKGLKLGFDRNPAHQRRLEQLRRQLIIAQVQKQEIEERLTINDADVQNYFLANREPYTDPNLKEPPAFEQVKERVREDYAHARMQQMYQELLMQTLAGTDVTLNLEQVK